MASPKRRGNGDDLDEHERVDRSALRVIAKRVVANERQDPHIAHELYILEPDRSPRRLGKRRR